MACGQFPGRNSLKNKWGFKIRMNADGPIELRLMIKGNSQVKGVDCLGHEVGPRSVPKKCGDLFLQDDLEDDDEIFMERPEGNRNFG